MIGVTYTGNWLYNLRVRMSLAGKSNTAGGPRGTVHGYVYICTSEEEESPMRSLEEERKEREGDKQKARAR